MSTTIANHLICTGTCTSRFISTISGYVHRDECTQNVRYGSRKAIIVKMYADNITPITNRQWYFTRQSIIFKAHQS